MDRRRSRFGIETAIRRARLRPVLALVLLALAFPVLAQRPPLVVPVDADTVVGRLPHGYARLEPAASPRDANRLPALATIQDLLQAAAATGDARLAARADALLARHPVPARDPTVLRLRAFSAQHRHDFAGALRLLDAAIARDPRDAAARLSRAQILIVQGRLDRARSDCRALALGVDVEAGLLCVASLSLRIGDYSNAAALLDRQLAQLPPGDARRAFALLTRAEIAARAGAGDADYWYRQALADAPGDVRVLVSYSRYLRHAKRDAEVEALLRDALQSDTAQLQRTLAARAAGRDNAAALAAAQARRYDLAHALGSQPEMRDEAEFLLTVRHDAGAALALAQRNFAQQRDVEDVDILVRAANAAGRPDALRELRTWAQIQRVPLSAGAGGG